MQSGVEWSIQQETDGAIIVRTYTDGAITTKSITAESLMGAFSLTKFNTGILPQDTLFVKQETNGEDVMGIFIPPKLWTLLVQLPGRVESLTFPLPSLVWVGAGTEYRCFAVKERPGNLHDQLYRTPLPNISGLRGNVCLGDNEKINCSAQTIRKAFDAFTASVFTPHYATGAVTGIGSGNIIDLLVHMHETKQEEFNYSALCESPVGLLENLIP